MKRIGIDIGSVSWKVVKLENNKILSKKIIYPIKEDPIKLFKNLIEAEEKPFYLGITGNPPNNFKNLPYLDKIKCIIKGVRTFHPDAENIIEIGAGSSKLIELDEEGNLKNLITNSVCAAGTGIFFDQQLKRLNLSYEDTEKFSLSTQHIPTIASRCTVFAKTDLINRQQEGYTKQEIWIGLCRGMATGVLQTLLKGRILKGKTVVTGGVTKNRIFMEYFKKKANAEIEFSEDSIFYGAIGSALLTQYIFDKIKIENASKKQRMEKRNPPLLLKKSQYPSFKPKEEKEEDGTEIRIHEIKRKELGRLYLGLDIGSTSTKAVLMDEENKIIADFYRRTEGDPILATQKIFNAIKEFKKRKGITFEIKGAGTTGSGRKLVGKFIGADLIINEITAHAKGALSIFPEAEVIFEIGGQDSKYIRLKDGNVFECNLNYVCAAGTGSFLEEQAEKLGFDIKRVSSEIMGVSPPLTQERCTVFMEQDIERLLREGYSKKEVMAASTYSVVYNYLNKVVGRRYIPKDRVFFQGATARNLSLVAAFENVLGLEVVVSPFCHVMGAYGTASLTKEKLEKENKKTNFKGFDLWNKKIKVSYTHCSLCENRCKITSLQIGKETVSFGFMCGREPEEKKRRNLKELSLFEIYEEKLFKGFDTKNNDYIASVGVPRALSVYSIFPFYKTFLEGIGFKVYLSKPLDEDTVGKGKEVCSSDFCYPVKILFGSVRELLEEKGIDYIFLPWIINFKYKNEKEYNYFCPYVQAHPGYIETTFSLRGVKKDKFLTPVFDFTISFSSAVKTLYEYFKKWGIKKKRVEDSLRKAFKVQKKFEKEIKEIGKKVMEGIEKDGKKAVVLIGRPYTIFNRVANLKIPLKIANLGLNVIPLTFLWELGDNPLKEKMYWNYGKKILKTLEFIKDKKNLYPLYLTNFSCGPDSFLLSYAEEILKNRPFLILEIDEHAGDAVFQTRIEAFYDVINKFEEKTKTHFSFAIKTAKEDKKHLIWIPSMHPVGARLFAATFRRFGYNAKALPLTDEEAWNKGKRLTRGAECLPCVLTLGTFLKEIEKHPEKKHTLFMPTSFGPCRFGQYVHLHKMILERNGYKNINILSPHSYNSYSGLPQELRKFLWKTILIYDALLKCRNRIKPYEIKKGETHEVFLNEVIRMEKALEERGNVFDALDKSIQEFIKIKVKNIKKPLIGVLGEIYVRHDPYANDEIIRCIENCGAEAWVSPVSEWIWYTNFTANWRAKKTQNFLELLILVLKNRFLRNIENKVKEITKPVLWDREEPEIEEIMKETEKYMPVNFGTETPLTIGRAVLFAKQGVKAVVNVSPFSCMPGVISQALFQKVSKDLNIPVINMFYDGEKGTNERLEIFLKNII